MVLTFSTDYRSRAWCQRFAAGAVVTTDHHALVDECVAAGVAVVVPDDPSAPSAAPLEGEGDDPVSADHAV